MFKLEKMVREDRPCKIVSSLHHSSISNKMATSNDEKLCEVDRPCDLCVIFKETLTDGITTPPRPSDRCMERYMRLLWNIIPPLEKSIVEL